MPTAIDLLLRELLAGPNLRGAACVDAQDIFDACTDKRASGQNGVRAYDRAIRVCASCPVLRQCRDFYGSLPIGALPYGVTAGLIRRCRY